MVSERLSRVSEQLRQVIAEVIQQDMKDPRVGFVTITRVDITPDLRLATVYFSALNPTGSAEDVLKGLNSARGFLRKRIGSQLHMKVTPDLRFKEDPSIEHSIRMSQMLDDSKPVEEGENA